MKKLLIILIAVFSFTVGFSQEKSSPVKESTIKVDGVCKMCKARIESAAMRTKGVKQADWDKVSKELTLVYNSKKTDLEKIKKAVALKGHESEGAPADSTAYSKLPGCCRYKHGAKCED